MKEEYVLFNRSEIELILSERSELQQDLNEMLNQKRWVISDTKDCKIRLDFNFLGSASNPYELFNICDLKERYLNSPSLF